MYDAWQLSRNRGGADDDKLTGVLSEARVDLNPHQVMAALFAFQSPFSKGVILADEVGLGKTIEAGIVISQFWAERKRKVLIVAPATLRRQWSMELEEKFFLPSLILEKKKGVSLDHLHDGKQIYICSYQFAARQADILSRTHWDLVVYDEAHKLRNVYKSTPSMASRLKTAFADCHKLLLTATPLQNNIEELYGLVSVIDDHYFGDLKSFKANNFYPDFILWILVGEKQYLTFIDPKGIRNLKGLNDDKIQLFRYLQTSVAAQVDNPNLIMNSFIISNTPMEQVEFWASEPFAAEEFAKNHVLFENKEGTHLKLMIEMILNQ